MRAMALFQLMLAFLLALLALVNLKLAILLSVMFFLYIHFFIMPEAGLYLLILFVPIGSLMIRAKFIDIYIPYAHQLHTTDNQNIYHLILAGVLTSLFIIGMSRDASKLAAIEIRFKRWLYFMFGVMAAWASFTMLWAPLKVHGLIHLAQLFVNIMLFFIPLMLIRDEKTLKRALVAWIVIGIAFAIGATADRIYAESISIIHRQTSSFDYTWKLPITNNLKLSFESKINTFRAAGLSRFDNASNMINMTIPLLLYFILSPGSEKKQRYRGFLIFFLLLLVFARMLIPNKSGLGSYLLSLTFLMFVHKPFSIRKVMLGLFLLVGISTILYLIAHYIFPDATGIMWLSKTMNLKDKSSAGTRWEWWTEAMRILVGKTYLMGLGMGGFKYYVSAPHAHSFILSFFFDIGIIGLFCILSLIGIIGINFVRPVLRQQTGLEKLGLFVSVSVLAFFMQGLVDFEYYMPEGWLFAGTAVATVSLIRTENKREQLAQI